MKTRIRNLIVVAMLGMSSIAYADWIKGIGEVQIGMTSDQFLNSEVASDLIIVDWEKLEIEKKFQKNGFDRKKYMLKRTSDDKPDEYGSKKVYSPKIVWYELYIPVSTDDTKKLKTKVELYKDKVTEIEVENGLWFVDVLTEKYGKPKYTSKKTSKYCAIGRKLYEHKDGYESWTWSKGNIYGSVTKFEHVMDDCQYNAVSSTYTVSNKAEWKAVFDSEYGAKEEYERGLRQKKMQEEKERVRAKSANSLL